MRLTKQMVEGARTIKVGGWEPLMAGRIRAARTAEMAILRRAGCLRAVNDGLYFLSPVLVGAAVFLTDWAVGRELDAGRVFTTLTLFGILQWNAVYMGGRALQSLNELWVSVNRLEHLFRMPELPPRQEQEQQRVEVIIMRRTSYPPPTHPPAHPHTNTQMLCIPLMINQQPTQRASAQAALATPLFSISRPPQPAAIRVRRLSFNYHGSQSKEMPALRQVSFNAGAGGIVGVVGPVGSGAGRGTRNERGVSSIDR